MYEYDVVLKLLLQSSTENLMQQLIGAPIASWLPIEQPKMQNPRVDLLGETAAGKLIQIELQSSNHLDMPLRMANYCLGVYRRFRRFPRQIVMYVGSDELRMADRLEGPSFSFKYELVDIRAIDGTPLLASSQTSDNVFAVLANLQNQRQTLKEIVDKVGEADVEQREFYLQALLTLAGLRGLEEMVEEEAKKVPILNSILDNKVLGREFKRGLHEGELALLRRQIESRFGSLPSSVDESLKEKSVAEIEALGVRLLDVQSLDELLR